MIRTLKLLLGFAMICQIQLVWAQKPTPGKSNVKAEVYYFHPTERCPIDQEIEATLRKLMQSDFAKEIKDGTLKFQVLNTDDKANAKTVAKFEMNAQALYLVSSVNGKEIKNDLTEFAFSNCQNNPGKFKAGLKQEILGAIK